MIKYTKSIFSLLVIAVVIIVFIGYKRDVVKGTNEKKEEEGVTLQSNGLLDEKLESGLLLGIRKDEKDGSSSYKTLWIACKDNKLQVVNSSEDIIMPYTNKKFIRISQKQQESKDNKSNFTYFVMTPFGSNEKNVTYEDQFDKITSKYRLDYVGNRYISYSRDANFQSGKSVVEVSETYVTDYSLITDESLEKGHTYIQQIDNSDNVKNIITEAKSIVSKANEDEKVYNNIDDLQWSVLRENGHWVGRIALSEYKESNFEEEKVAKENGEEVTKNIATKSEFSHSLLKDSIELPPIIVPYDELVISYDKLKNRFQDAIDAFISPTDDILLIVTNNKLKFYQITDKIAGFPQILDQPILEIKKDSNEKIIMNNWATYDYVDQWTDSFEKYLNVKS